MFGLSTMGSTGLLPGVSRKRESLLRSNSYCWAWQDWKDTCSLISFFIFLSTNNRFATIRGNAEKGSVEKDEDADG